MAEGTVLWYSPQLGYGFIGYEDTEGVKIEAKRIFVDSTNIAGDEALEEGDKVSFEKSEGEQGVEAIKVVKTESLGASTGGIPKKL
jgi:cold shock CspA family protein